MSRLHWRTVAIRTFWTAVAAALAGATAVPIVDVESAKAAGMAGLVAAATAVLVVARQAAGHGQ